MVPISYKHASRFSRRWYFSIVRKRITISRAVMLYKAPFTRISLSTLVAFVRLLPSVHEEVLCEITTPVKRLVADTAHVQPLPSVQEEHVRRQIALLRERLAAEAADVRPLLGVTEIVPPEIARLRERLVANGTHVLLIPSVDAHQVLIQRAFQGKRFAAHVALVWFLPCVGVGVSGKSPLVGELLFANVTHMGVLPAVYEKVGDETAFLDERLVARGADVWFQARVDHKVPLQSTLFVEGFSTYFTRVGLLTRVNE